MHLLDKSFIRSPKSYILQSLLAVITVLIILTFVEVLTHTAIVAALGSSAFIVFAMPNHVTAGPRRLIGGHIVGIICGLFCYYLFLTGPLGEISEDIVFVRWFAAAFSVGLSIFLMTITNTEHAPAAATALGITIHVPSYQVALFILACSILLAVTRRFCRGWLKNLF